MSNFEDDFARGCLPTGEPLECLYGMGWWSELPEEKPAEPEPEPEPKASGGAGMNRWRAEYAVNGIWRFYRDGMELGLYEKGDVVIDALNNAESRIAELEAEKEIMKDQQREAKNILIDKNLHIDSLYEEGYKLQQRIAELEEKQRWIPVSERLPDEGKPIWICTIWNEQHSGLFVNGYWTGLFRDFRNGEVTHWMPLPELPVDQPTADSTDERKDDKLPEREVCEACGGDGTLLLVDNYKGQATATVDCPYCNCTGYVKECER